jgi:hypothetical protein
MKIESLLKLNSKSLDKLFSYQFGIYFEDHLVI